MNYQGIITLGAVERGGRPCVRGTRITVYDILKRLAGGMTNDQILAEFPELTPNDIRAALAYAADRNPRLAFPPP